MLNVLSLFTGYDGMGLGLQLAGIEYKTVGYCDNDKFIQDLLRQRIKDGLLQDAPIIDNIYTDWSPYFGLVGLLTGGFPCQPNSIANSNRQGEFDPRNCWPATRECIVQVRPQYVILENVTGILSGIDGRPPYAGNVIADLVSIGYDTLWDCVSASDAGAPHRRLRWWCFAWLPSKLADSDSERLRVWLDKKRGVKERLIQ